MGKRAAIVMVAVLAVLALVGPGEAALRPLAERDALASLLRYIPPVWADTHPADLLGPPLYFLDLARMRRELGSPASLSTQGLELMPDSDQFLGSGAEARWGWDLADIDQSLYVPDVAVAVLQGRFRLAEIEDRLRAQGYRGESLGPFTVWVLESGGLVLISKPGALIVSESEIVARELAQQTIDPVPTLDHQPAMAELLPYLQGAWGALLAPSGDPAAIDPQIRGYLGQAWPSLQPGKDVRAGWDMLAIAFSGPQARTVLRFLYHYPSPEEAARDVGLVRAGLTAGAVLRSPGQTWGSLVRLQGVQAEGNLIVATATAGQSLLGEMARRRDLGFLPFRVLAAASGG